jgi:hypothetical protein
MDVSKYLGSAFLKVADVKVYGPIRVVIVLIVEGKFDKPDLVFDDGTRLSLNVTNTRILARAYGTDTAFWIGKEIELNVGDTEYQGKPQESILITPISPPIDKKARVDGPTSARRIRGGPTNDMDDEIPF